MLEQRDLMAWWIYYNFDGLEPNMVSPEKIRAWITESIKGDHQQMEETLKDRYGSLGFKKNIKKSSK